MRHARKLFIIKEGGPEAHPEAHPTGIYFVRGWTGTVTEQRRAGHNGPARRPVLLEADHFLFDGRRHQQLLNVLDQCGNLAVMLADLAG